jgi:RNA polymerase sigma-32 factor
MGRNLGPRNAGDRLVTSHLGLVVSVAAGYSGYGLPAGEIISEGNPAHAAGQAF